MYYNNQNSVTIKHYLFLGLVWCVWLLRVLWSRPCVCVCGCVCARVRVWGWGGEQHEVEH